MSDFPNDDDSLRNEAKKKKFPEPAPLGSLGVKPKIRTEALLLCSGGSRGEKLQNRTTQNVAKFVKVFLLQGTKRGAKGMLEIHKFLSASISRFFDVSNSLEIRGGKVFINPSRSNE